MKKYAIITGASSGIGLELAKKFAEDDYDLLIVSRDKNDLQDVAALLHSEYGAKSDLLAIDLTEKNAADEVWKKVGTRKVDALVNNAGFGDLEYLIDADWSKLEHMIALNITVLTRLSQLAAKHMKKNKSGHILNLASIAAFLPGPGMAVYYATKSYVLNFSEALSQELKEFGVSVTALCPGPTQSHFAQTAGADKSAIFSGKLPTADEVAQYGYAAMQSGRVVAVHGVRNKLTVLVLPRLLPRFVIRKLVDKFQNS